MRSPQDNRSKPDQAKPGFWDRCNRVLTGINNQFHFFVSLPVVTVVGSLLAGHFQYLSTYQDKVNTQAQQEMAAAETAFTEISTTFSKAITLQQFLFFNYRDAIKAKTTATIAALETKNARAIYPKYDELRMSIRENIDLLARKVEMSLDWPSDTDRDAANVGTIGRDPMSRLKLGAYNFDCGEDHSMPNFHPGKSHVDLPPPQEMLKDNPNAQPLGVDWYSAKHQLLTLYYCFEVTHRRITVARQWAANSPIDAGGQEKICSEPRHDQGQLRSGGATPQ